MAFADERTVKPNIHTLALLGEAKRGFLLLFPMERKVGVHCAEEMILAHIMGLFGVVKFSIAFTN